VSCSARPLTRPASNPGDELNSTTGTVCTHNLFPFPRRSRGDEALFFSVPTCPGEFQCKVKNARSSLLNESRCMPRLLLFMHPATHSRSEASAFLFTYIHLSKSRISSSLATSHSSLATDHRAILSHTLHTSSCVAHTVPTHNSAQINSFAFNGIRRSTQFPHTFCEKINTHTIPFPRTFSPRRAYLSSDRVGRMIDKPGKGKINGRRAS